MDHFDQNIDWVEYDAPGPDNTSSDSSGSGYGSSNKPQSMTGAYLPPWRRNGSQDGIALSEGKVARVNAKGEAKILLAPPNVSGAFNKIQRVGYSLTKTQMDYMKVNFPNTAFQVIKDHNHDHPVAHLETAIACRHLLDTIKDGKKILDVYGNPESVDKFMARNDLRGRSMEAICYAFTEKDELRAAMKWGDQVDGGRQRYREMQLDGLLRGNEIETTTSFDHFMFVHTLYYVDFTLLAALLALRPRASTFKAIVHRHKNAQGSMFGGEVEYVKEHGIVVQTNVATGERYTHRDLEWMFTSRTKVWRSAGHAFTWTFKKVTDETWIIEGAACRNDLDERFRAYSREHGPEEAAARMNQEDLLPSNLCEKPLPKIAGCVVKNIGGVIVAVPQEVGTPIEITNRPFFDYLATSMVGKPRDEERLKDLFALARRENATTSTFPGSKKFNVPAELVADHVHLAFHSGVERETMLMSAFAATRQRRKQLDKLANGGNVDVSVNGAVSGVLRAARIANNARRTKDTFGAILDGVDSFT